MRGFTAMLVDGFDSPHFRSVDIGIAVKVYKTGLV